MDIQSDAPTVGKSTLRLVLSVCANEGWLYLEALDVKAAFLQSRKINRDIYIVPPVEAELMGKLWKLKKTAYGLIDAANEWYFTIREHLITLGCIQSYLDKAVFNGFLGFFLMLI